MRAPAVAGCAVLKANTAKASAKARTSNGDSTRETRSEARRRSLSLSQDGECEGKREGEDVKRQFDARNAGRGERGTSARIEAWNECSRLNVFVAAAAVAAIAATPNRTS